jgi:hypothetical protein
VSMADSDHLNGPIIVVSMLADVAQPAARIDSGAGTPTRSSRSASHHLTNSTSGHNGLSASGNNRGSVSHGKRSSLGSQVSTRSRRRFSSTHVVLPSTQYLEHGLRIQKWDTIRHRMTDTLVFAPSIFFASFCWEGFGLIATSCDNVTTTDGAYYILTGIGDLVGSTIWTLGFIGMQTYLIGCDHLAYDLGCALHLGLSSSLVAGTLWQFSVNQVSDRSTDFTSVFFLVFLLNGFAFFYCAHVLVRYLNVYLIPECYQLHISPPSAAVLLDDLTLALALGTADAFFAGTEGSLDPGNWLSCFGVYDNTPVLTAMCLAGASSFCGFIIGKSSCSQSLTCECIRRDLLQYTSCHNTQSKHCRIFC